MSVLIFLLTFNDTAADKPGHEESHTPTAGNLTMLLKIFLKIPEMTKSKFECFLNYLFDFVLKFHYDSFKTEGEGIFGQNYSNKKHILQPL